MTTRGLLMESGNFGDYIVVLDGLTDLVKKLFPRTKKLHDIMETAVQCENSKRNPEDFTESERKECLDRFEAYCANSLHPNVCRLYLELFGRAALDSKETYGEGKA